MTNDTASLRKDFDEAVRTRGGRLTPGAVSPSTQQLLEQYLRLARMASGEVHVDYVNNLDLNAEAIVYAGRELVGVYLGAVLTIADVIRTVESVCPQMEDLESLDGSDKRMAGLRARLKTGRQAMASSAAYGLPPLPMEPQRRAFVAAAMFAAIDFLVHHEFAHHEMGHLEFLCQTKSLRSLPELGVERETMATASMCQAIELDADAAATGVSLSRLLKIAATFRESAEKEVWIGWLADPKAGFRIWLLVTGVLFFLFGRAGVEWNDEIATHPHPMFRMMWAHYHAARRLKGEERAIQTVFESTLHDVNKSHARLWTALGGGVKQVREHLGTQEEVEREWDRLMANVEDTWPRLQTCCRARWERKGRP